MVTKGPLPYAHKDMLDENYDHTRHISEQSQQRNAAEIPCEVNLLESHGDNARSRTYDKQAAAHAEMMLASVQNAQVRVVDTGKVWKVLSGNFASKDEASQFARTVTQALGSPAFAVAQ